MSDKEKKKVVTAWQCLMHPIQKDYSYYCVHLKNCYLKSSGFVAIVPNVLARCSFQSQQNCNSEMSCELHIQIEVNLMLVQLQRSIFCNQYELLAP